MIEKTRATKVKEVYLEAEVQGVQSVEEKVVLLDGDEVPVSPVNDMTRNLEEKLSAVNKERDSLFTEVHNIKEELKITEEDNIQYQQEVICLQQVLKDQQELVCRLQEEQQGNLLPIEWAGMGAPEVEPDGTLQAEARLKASRDLEKGLPQESKSAIRSRKTKGKLLKSLKKMLPSKSNKS